MSRRLLGCVVVLAAMVAAAVVVGNWREEAQAASLQGDVTCDEDVTLEDAVAILRDRGGVGPVAPCLAVAGDVNCDGVIDARDVLWLVMLEAGIGLQTPAGCTAVGSNLVVGVADASAAIELQVSPRTQCAVEVPFYEVNVEWEIVGVAPPVDVEITAVFSTGITDFATSMELQGQAQFIAPDTGPATVKIVVKVVTATDEFAAEEVVQLDTCFPTPATPQPGAGFFALPTPGPPDLPLAGNPGPVNEVDAVHIGGSPSGPTQDISVVGVGTGAAWRLLSYGTSGSPDMPVAMDQTAAFGGREIQLIALDPDVSPGLSLNLLVAAYLRDGNLWLSSWRINSDGEFTPLDKRGFGSNLGITVQEYGIAQRPIPPNSGGPDRYQVVTPIIGSQVTPQGAANDLGVRMVTWSVDGDTGLISGLQATSEWGNPHEDTHLSITALDGESVNPGAFVLAYRDVNDIMETQYWYVENDGEPFLRGLKTTGYTRNGTGNAAEEMRHVALAPLTDGGFVGPYVNTSSLQMVTWETRLDFCFFTACFFAPYRISDQTLDMDFNTGVTLPFANQPTLNGEADPQVAGGAFQNVRAILSESGWEEEFGVGDGQMFSQIPQGEVTSVGIASVTKVMTLLVAVEAIEDGSVALSDDVTVSQAAANVGGSQANIQQGDVLQLDDLFAAMMTVSGNDASISIAEYVGGTQADFVTMMNDKANELGLSNTTYNHPAGGGYSTPQDQVTLFREAWKHPIFRTFSTVKTWNACGVDVNAQPVCYPLTKFSDSGYPGLEGWKNGDLGFIDPAQQGAPLCTSCLLVQAKRLGRTLIVALQQSGNRWSDSTDLFEFGYLTLFTPDRVAGGNTGSANDFGLDAIDDGLSILAYIDGEANLQVCIWSTFADGGQLSQNGCDSPRLPNMLAGTAPPPTRVDSARISTLLREGDYLTAYWLAGHLELQLWQVAPKEP